MDMRRSFGHCVFAKELFGGRVVAVSADFYERGKSGA